MSIIKVNLGSGPTGIEGWINLDWGWLPFFAKIGLIPLLVKVKVLKENYLVSWPKFWLHDIQKKLKFKDDSIDFGYCSHVLEHFERQEGLLICQEMSRVLKKGGILRVVLPDLDRIVRGNFDANKLNEFWWGYDKRSLVGWRRLAIRPHHWMYDKRTASDLLKEAGFKKVRIVSFREGDCPDIEKLDLEGHKDVSMYLEATK